MVTTETILECFGTLGGSCVVKFTDVGYQVIRDSREVKVGYLHIGEESSDSITEDCRNQIINYMFHHKTNLPGVGQTVMEQYFKDLTKADCEAIGNDGKKAYYN